MKKIISLVLATIMVFSLCSSAFAEIVTTDVTLADGKIANESSIAVNKEADEKFGDVYRTTHSVLSFDENGKLIGVNTTDDRLNNYLTLGKETEVDFTKIQLPEGVNKAKVLS